ncbi:MULTISPECIES: methyltransferase domain-containing protein [Streptomyces]|uniref:methyltransferase domain-containing protein n=1 Tax=Streptomyces TaxID=1883 RepID=UPI00163D2C34|nr:MULTISPECIES: methyltransferase domain-containing protein [Streptomyces]MBC2876438.1 methyltransferase domain-containing protein [Streptomyces sp. TYQ1024]UBI40892.1 methyltransferase domain-containing protein [Streptomyces mobaraensis]
MGDFYVPHAFSDIDAHPDPGRLVTTLHRLRAESFFVSYKQRLRGLLRAQPGRRFLDVGAGTGDAVRELEAETGAEAVACDLSQTMCAEMKRAGLRRLAVADSRRLPFKDGAFDGAWADRVLQHVQGPGQALDEMLRVVRPGGRIVICDPDTATQALNIEDHQLAAEILDLRQRVSVQHGTFARRVPGLLTARGLLDVEVEPRTLLVRDKSTVDDTMGIRSWAEVFADLGHLDRSEAQRFNTLLDKAIEGSQFLYSVTYFLTSATVR